MTAVKQAIFSIEKALDQGLVFQAHNIASELLLDYPDHKRLTQLKVITLNRLGQPEKAIETIQQIIRKGAHDGETMGLLGRTYKDLYKSSGDMTYLEKAAEAYYKGYLQAHDYYPGVNAASLYIMLNNREKARDLALALIKEIGEPDDYWAQVTLGEIWLILGEIGRSKLYFEKAVHENRKQFGKFKSTSDQLHFLGQSFEIPTELFALFPKPKPGCFFRTHDRCSG